MGHQVAKPPCAPSSHAPICAASGVQRENHSLLLVQPFASWPRLQANLSSLHYSPNAAYRKHPHPTVSTKQLQTGDADVASKTLDLLEIFLSISHTGERSELPSAALALIPTRNPSTAFKVTASGLVSHAERAEMSSPALLLATNWERCKCTLTKRYLLATSPQHQR